MELVSFNQAWHEIRETFSSFMQDLENRNEYRSPLQDSRYEPSTSESTGEMNSNADNTIAMLAPMIQQMMEQQTMLDQMFVDHLRQREEIISYVNDPFRPLDFSSIERYPHELQYDIWEKHVPEFDGNQDPSKLTPLFVNFIATYNIIHEDVFSFHKKAPRILVLQSSKQIYILFL